MANEGYNELTPLRGVRTFSDLMQDRITQFISKPANQSYH